MKKETYRRRREVKHRYIAHWFLGGSNHDQITGEKPEDLTKFIMSRIPLTQASLGGINLCVGDLKSRSLSPWIWCMESGGKITINHRYPLAHIVAKLWGGEIN